MFKRQRGISLLAVMFLGSLIVFTAILTLKIAPAYLEENTLKQLIKSSLKDSNNPADIRKRFDKYAEINDLRVFSGNDLGIEKEGNEWVVSYDYVKRIDITKNIHLEIDFSGRSKEQP